MPAIRRSFGRGDIASSTGFGGRSAEDGVSSASNWPLLVGFKHLAKRNRNRIHARHRMCLDSVGGVLEEQCRVYRLTCNGHLKPSEMSQMLGGLRGNSPVDRGFAAGTGGFKRGADADPSHR